MDNHCTYNVECMEARGPWGTIWRTTKRRLRTKKGVGGMPCILSTLYPMESSLTMASAFRSASRNYPVTCGTCIRAHAQSMLDMPGAGCNAQRVHF